MQLLGSRTKNEIRRPLLAEEITDAQGNFRLKASRTEADLLQIMGPDGTGRLKLPATGDNPLAVTYPVQTTVLLLHDNDLHFNINHAEAFTETVADLRRKHSNVFLLNAGDIFIRGAAQQKSKEKYAMLSRRIITWMNSLQYDAVTLGNNELDYVDNLTLEALQEAEFPLLAANIERQGEQLPQWRPSVVLHTDNDLSLFVLGLSCLTSKKPGLAMADPLQTALMYREQAAEHNAFIGLTHLGLVFDQVLARLNCGFDVIIGGHCHTLLSTAIMADDVLIAQAGGPPADKSAIVDPSIPKYLGIITLEFENERLVGKKGRVITFK